MIAGPSGKNTFSFARNSQTVFQSGVSHSHQSSLVLSAFWILAILTDVSWYPTVVLICISPMAGNIGRLFICLFAIVYHLWYEMYLKVFGLFFNQVVCFLILILFFILFERIKTKGILMFSV